MNTAILVGFFVAALLTSHHKLPRSNECKDIFAGTFASYYHRSITPVTRDRKFAYKPYLHMILLLLSGDVEINPGPNSESTSICQRCTTKNNRKRKIKCKNCKTWWHLSCVHITRSQAAALAQWWCPDCMTDDGPSDSRSILSQPPFCTNVFEDPDIADTIAKLKRSCRVIPRIPRGARIQVAEALTKLIETALDEKSAAAWSQLLSFPLLALSVPSRDKSSPDVSFTTKIKRQVSDYIIGGATHCRAKSDEGRARLPGPRQTAPGSSSNTLARH